MNQEPFTSPKLFFKFHYGHYVGQFFSLRFLQVISYSHLQKPPSLRLPPFPGLLLCTSTGVLQEGRAGTDVAVEVAQCAKRLDTRAAEASNKKDKAMIHAPWMAGGWLFFWLFIFSVNLNLVVFF